MSKEYTERDISKEVLMVFKIQGTEHLNPIREHEYGEDESEDVGKMKH